MHASCPLSLSLALVSVPGAAAQYSTLLQYNTVRVRVNEYCSKTQEVAGHKQVLYSRTVQDEYM